MIYLSKMPHAMPLEVILPRGLYKVRFGIRADTKSVSSTARVNLECSSLDVSARLCCLADYPSSEDAVFPLNQNVIVTGSYALATDEGWASFERVGDF